MKRNLFVVFLLLLAGASYAQPPRIDSMFVDEAKSELQINGDFGSAMGAVWVDSVELQITNWADTFIVATIPSSGKGSAGPVVVGGRGYQSEARMLTMWGMGIGYGETQNGQAALEYVHEEWALNWRADLDSRFRRTQAEYNKSIPVMESSYEHYTYHNEYYSPYPKRVVEDDQQSASGSTLGSLDLRTLTFYFVLGELVSNSHFNGGGNVSTSLDSNLVPQNGNPVLVRNTVIFPPTKQVLQLWYKPTLVSPPPSTIYSYRDIATLTWDSLSLMTKYHLQVSVDSLFKTQYIDTTIFSLSLSLPPLNSLTKYFWRVVGVNSEGESRWSDVWNFTTGGTADVAETQTPLFNFSAYPNPATDKLTISYSTSHEEIAIALYDLLGNKVRNLINQGGGARATEMSLTGLPGGMYVLELQNGGVHKSMPISILR